LRLYLAYGSNLSTARMAHRCPAAVPIRAVTVPDWRLRFETVATLEPAPGDHVPAALYGVTAACETALDRVEGVDEGRYRRHWVDIPDDAGTTHRVLTYIKVDARRGPPRGAYVRHIAAGYHDWGHDLSALLAALRRCRPASDGSTAHGSTAHGSTAAAGTIQDGVLMQANMMADLARTGG